METFRQKLTSLHLTSEQINAVCQLINDNIIGEYEASTIQFQSPKDVERWTEKDNDLAVRNALKREQRKKLR